MSTAKILKIKNCHILATVWLFSWCWCVLILSTVKICQIWKFKMADGRHFEKLKTHHVSPTFQPVATIFGTVMHTAPLNGTTTTTSVLRPFVRDYPSEPVPEETLTHPPSWSSSNLYQLLLSTTIHSILLVQITCLAISLHNLFLCPLLSTSCSGALHLIFHTFLRPISVFFSQHMPIPSQAVLL